MLYNILVGLYTKMRKEDGMKEKPVSMTKLRVSRGKLKVMKCDTCKKEFLAGGVKIEEQCVTPWTKETGAVDAEEIMVTYFRCPHCLHAYVVTIDNDETLAMRNGYQLLANRLAKDIQSKRRP